MDMDAPVVRLVTRGFILYATVIFLYIGTLLSLTNTSFQRNAFYLNSINPLKLPWPLTQSLDDFEKYGFFNNQVTPFNITTYDSETISAYHILPLELYHDHEQTLYLTSEVPRPQYTAANVTSAYPIDLLLSNPKAKVIINFHGNAGHTFMGHRPALYRSLLSQSTPEAPVHLFVFDYRGFGRSTGSPTEEGLTSDGLAMLKLLTSPPFSINSDRIILVGQSLGTAVSTATAHAWAFNSSHPANPSTHGAALSSLNLIIMSSFTNVPDLLSVYSVQGVIPPIFVLLKNYPNFKRYLISFIVDTWNTASRLHDLTSKDWPSGSIQVSIMHARNDRDIPWYEGVGNWNAALKGARSSEGSEAQEGVQVKEMGEEHGHQVKEWRNDGRKAAAMKDGIDETGKGSKLIRWERAMYGAHNAVGLQEWSRLAVKRVLEAM